MQFSRFNISTPDARGGLILYNSLTGALVTFNPVLGEKVRVALAADKPQLLAPRVLKAFVEDGYVVSDPVSETAIVRTRNFLGRTQNELIVSAMLTLRCNFGCSYCFQERSAWDMNIETERRVLRMIEREAPKKERISIDWYGGEPLLRKGQLRRMNSAVAEICRHSGTQYVVSVTTNGYLLDSSMVSYLSTFTVSQLQITLDGPADTHDLSRPTAGGKRTFGRVLASICRAIDTGINVSVRVNLWRPNLGRVLALYDILEEAGLKNRVNVLIKPVLSSPTNPCSEQCLAAEEASSAILSVYRDAALKGWIVLPFVEQLQGHEFCIVDSKGQMIVDPSGNLYKCGERFVREERVGSISAQGEICWNEPEWVKWISKDPFNFPECRQCQILPICMGGCSMKRLWRPNEPACVEFKHSLPQMLEVLALNQAVISGGRRSP